MPWFDTHAHLDSHDFADESVLRALLSRAAESGVVGILSLGVTADSSASTLALAARCNARGGTKVYAGVGIHPNYLVTETRPGDWERVVEMASRPEVLAIGETGLDRHWDHTPFPVQQESFEKHIDLAQKLGKPFVVHCRECEADVLEMLRSAHQRHGALHGVMHSCVNTWEAARECLDMGLHLSFAGMLTYKNAEEVRQTAAKAPLDRLLVETDSPYLAPVPHRGKKNEPAFVALTGARLAEVRGESVETVQQATTANAFRWLGIPVPSA